MNTGKTGTGLLAHEWISHAGGSENVLEQLAAVFPEAPIFALWQDEPSRFAPGRVCESALSGVTVARRNKALALPFMMRVWRRLDLSQFEWLVVSSHAFAHQLAANPTAPDRTHVYVHTPARYVWTPEFDGRGSGPWHYPARQIFRHLDRKRVSPTACFAANSLFVSERVEMAWDRSSRVIYPPVAVEEIQAGAPWADSASVRDCDVISKLPDHFVLGASRFIPYKRLDLAIKVGELLDVPVVIAGDGPEGERLEGVSERASVPVTVVRSPSNALLRALMERAGLFVFPPVEDFGIMPVEAASLGTPSLVNLVGGAKESVRILGSGSAVDFSDLRAVREAAVDQYGSDDPVLRHRARFFSNARFAREVREWQRGADC